MYSISFQKHLELDQSQRGNISIKKKTSSTQQHTARVHGPRVSSIETLMGLTESNEHHNKGQNHVRTRTDKEPVGKCSILTEYF